jgi:probable phosphoglycerate mutase
LWEGLTEERLKARFPKAYKRWKEDPSSVCPPEGEGIEAAAERMRKALRTVQRKAERAAVGLVLGPVACAIVHCELQHGSLGRLRDFVLHGPYTYADVEGALQPAVQDDVE